MKSLVHGVRLLRRGPAALAGVLLIAASAYAHTIGPSFTEAEDLGTTTDWSTAGITSVADIPDVEGDGANYFKFRVAERGTVFVWSSGNITPYLQVFEESATAIGSESRSRREVVLDAGVHYVRARWRDAGRYRLHVAGGGRGHDDVGNTYAEAMTLSQPDEPQSDKVPWNPETYWCQRRSSTTNRTKIGLSSLFQRDLRQYRCEFGRLGTPASTQSYMTQSKSS